MSDDAGGLRMKMSLYPAFPPMAPKAIGFGSRNGGTHQQQPCVLVDASAFQSHPKGTIRIPRESLKAIEAFQTSDTGRKLSVDVPDKGRGKAALVQMVGERMWQRIEAAKPDGIPIMGLRGPMEEVVAVYRPKQRDLHLLSTYSLSDHMPRGAGVQIQLNEQLQPVHMKEPAAAADYSECIVSTAIGSNNYLVDLLMTAKLSQHKKPAFV